MPLAYIDAVGAAVLQQQLIERRDDPSDRRVIRVALTEGGRNALSEAAVPSHALLNSMFATMGSEKVETLASSLEQMVAAAERNEFAP